MENDRNILLYDGIHDVADLLCARDRCDLLYVFDRDRDTADYLSALFRNDARAFIIHGQLDADTMQVAAGPLPDLLRGASRNGKLYLSILLGRDITRNADAFEGLAKTGLVRGIEWRIPASTARMDTDDPEKLIEGLDRIFPGGHRTDTRRTTIPGGRPAFIVTTWDFYAPDTQPGTRAPQARPSGHRLLNVVYAHLRTEDIHAVHRGNASVIWSRFPVEGSDLHLYLNAYSYAGRTEGLDVLLLSEPVIVLPGQYNDDVWQHFDHVITLYDHFIETRPGFSKNLYPRSGLNLSTDNGDAASTADPLERQRKYPLEDRLRGMMLVNGNKHSRVPGELYSKRIEAALWFHNNSDLPFDVYGTPPFLLPNYRGTIPVGSRLATVARYRYCLCFENTNHPVLSPGYVEKILDCMETRTVPVYLGAPNIGRYIPEDCYIDFRRFKSYAELDSYLRSMTDDEYFRYVENIDVWVAAGGLSHYTWESLYNRMIGCYAADRGIPLSALVNSGDVWTMGMSPLAGAVKLAEKKGTSLWSFRDLALRGSPLVTEKDRDSTFEARIHNKEILQRIEDLTSSGSTREAIDAFSDLVWEGAGDHHYRLGQLLLQADNTDAAKVQLEAALSLDPNHSYAHNDIAGILFAQGDINKSVEHYHKAVFANPDNDCAIENLTGILLKLGFAPYAQSFIEDCINRSPGNGRIRNIAEHYGLKIPLPSTMEGDAPASPKGPPSRYPGEGADTGHPSGPQQGGNGRKDPIGSEIDGVIAMQQEGNLEGAQKALEPLLAREPGNADVRYLNARLFMADGDMRRAIDELAETVRLDPGHSNALNDLGCMAFQQEKYQEAFESLKRAIVSDRTNYMALQNMLVLLSRLRSGEPSLDVVGILRDLYPEGFRDIGANDGAAKKRALVIYADEAIPWALGNMLEHFPYLNGHSMWWETAEMVRLLNQRGYTVDYIGLPVQHLVDAHWDWDRYDLVIDGGDNNLLKCAPSQHPVKVFYSTGKHWLLANAAEAQRNLMFYRRHGVHMPLERTQRNNFSDENADYLTYFGNESQLEGYSANPRKMPLNISSTCIPPYREKDVSRAKKSYMWLGGQAMVHKGLDLTVEAFARMPEFNLHICANLEIEPRFFNWLKGYLRKCPNIIYHGPQNVASAGFQELAWNSVGTVYVSAAEGGPGSVAQLLHFGIIPIVTRTSNVRAEHLGYIIDDTSDNRIIDGTVSIVRHIDGLSGEDLTRRCAMVREHALSYHTREAYSRSFDALIDEIERERKETCRYASG